MASQRAARRNDHSAPAFAGHAHPRASRPSTNHAFHQQRNHLAARASNPWHKVPPQNEELNVVRSCRLVSILAALAAMMLIPASARAADGHTDRQERDGSSRAYSCDPATSIRRDATPPDPVLSPEAARVVANERTKLAANPDCPAGTVLVPEVLKEQRAHRRS